MTARRVAEGIVASAVGFASNTGMQLVSVPILVHFWGLAQYGLWVILTAIPTYFMLGNLGLTTVASNDMAASLAANDIHRARAIYSTATVSIVSISGLLFLVGMGIALFLPTHAIPAGDHIGPHQMRLAIIALVAYSIMAVNTELAMVPFRATGKYARGVNSISVIILLERSAVLACATFGIHVAAFAMVAVRFAGICYMFMHSRRANPELVPSFKDATFDEARRLAKLGMGIILFTLGMALNLQGPIMTVGILLPPTVIALFSATRTLTRFGIQAAAVISSPVMAEFAIATGAENTEKQKRLFSFNVVVVGILLAAAFVVFVILGPQLTYLWLVKTAKPDLALMFFVAAGSVLQGFWVIAANLLLASNRQYSFTPVLCLTGVVAICAGALATMAWGVDGMAAVMMLAELFMCFWVYRKAAKFGFGTLREAPAIAMSSAKDWHARRQAARQAKG